MKQSAEKHHPMPNGLPLLETQFERYGAAAIILVLVVGSQFLSGYYVSLLTTITIFSLAAMGLNLLSGNAGLISIAHAAFMGVGAFTAAWFVIDMGLPLLLALLLAGFVTAVVGLLFGLPSLRLSGVYLILATFAAQVILYWFFEQALWLTKSPDGRPVGIASIAGFHFDDSAHYFLLVLAFTVAGGVVYLNLLRSGLGRSMEAIRDRPVVAQLMGMNLQKTKLVAFATGHFYAGLAGALYGWHLQFVATEAFNLMRSIEMLVLIIIGGLGSLAGAVLGAIFIVLVPEFLDMAGNRLLDDVSVIAPLRLGIFGLLVVLFLLYEPRGLARSWRKTVHLFNNQIFKNQTKQNRS
ncbi:MAG: branched-chain amino acid ABC transporter permease [Balneolaceae bacterium]|nr:branched-chain amino acid ABC transporter permease [Balneolaceae bacterium]